jgi:hypothetical protein
MHIDDFEDWQGKYNIGDLFVDTFASEDLLSYIYRIEYQPDSKTTYYWVRYLNEDHRDAFFTEEQLDYSLENLVLELKHYPVKR